MTRLINALWDPPPEDAPRSQHQTYRLMMQTLKNVQSRVPTVFSEPSEAGGARVMNAAIGASLNPKVPAEERHAALTMLQKRMLTVDKDTPCRLFVSAPDHSCPINTTFGDELEALEKFERSLEAFVLRTRPGRVGHAAQPVPETPHVFLGLLTSMLVIRLGNASMTVLAKTMAALDSRPCIAGPWAWVDLDLAEPGKGAAQLHRLHMDPTTLAAWLKAASGAASLPQPAKTLKARQRTAFYKKLAKKTFKTLVRTMARDPSGSQPITSLDQLCQATMQRLRMTSMPLLATYAAGEVVSSSLEPGTWLRLIGYRAPRVKMDSGTVGTQGKEDSRPPPLTTAKSSVETHFDEQVMQGELEDDKDSLIVKLRRTLATPRATWDEGLTELVLEIEGKSPSHEAAKLVVRWVRYLASERRNNGKALRDGSIQNYRGLLANRLVQYLPPRLSDLDDEELLEAYVEVIMSRHSVEQTSRITAALVSFDRYVRAEHLPDLPPVHLPGFETGGYAISSRIIVEQEFQEGLALIDRGILAFGDEALADQTRAFWVLAFRLTLRRKEILGLKVRDLDEELLRVRPNDVRSLKTSNAERTLPLHALRPEERELVLRLTQNRDLEEFVFFGPNPPTPAMLEGHPVVAKINDLLERITGDRRLHPHNLRHSTATLVLFGALGRDLGLASHPYVTGWMKDAMKESVAIEEAVSGQLCRKGGRGSALAMLMGHGSELTTYEHYAHSLDLLLFLSCWHGRFNESRQRRHGRIGPPRLEAAQLLAMLGYEETTRIEIQNIPELLQRIAQRHPEHVEVLAPRKPSLHAIMASEAESGGDNPLDFARLHSLPSASTWEGFPDTQAKTDTAIAILHKLTGGGEALYSRLNSVAARWVAAKLNTYDYASMTGNEVRAWLADLKALSPDLRVEALHVYRPPGSGKKRKVPVTEPDDSASYNDHRRCYWVRIVDSRDRRDGPSCKPDRRRSRLQASISWLLKALVVALQGKLAVEVPPSEEVSSGS